LPDYTNERADPPGARELSRFDGLLENVFELQDKVARASWAPSSQRCRHLKPRDRRAGLQTVSPRTTFTCAPSIMPYPTTRAGSINSSLEHGRVDEGGFGMRVTRRAAARCRASFFDWHKDGSPLTLQQHHDEPGRLRIARVAPHDVNIGGPLVECLPGLERDGRLAF